MSKKIIPLSNRSRKIIPLTVGNKHIIPLTIDNSKILPMMCEEDFYTPSDDNEAVPKGTRSLIDIVLNRESLNLAPPKISVINREPMGMDSILDKILERKRKSNTSKK